MPRIGLDIAPQLDARLEQQLRQEFKLYQILKLKQARVELEVEAKRARIEKLREESGLAAIDLDGFKSQRVEPNRRQFNQRKFITLGGDLTIYNDAHEVVPGTPYERITLPKQESE